LKQIFEQMDDINPRKRPASAIFESPPDDPQTSAAKSTIDTQVSKDANSFLRFYRSLPEKPTDLVRFFERGVTIYILFTNAVLQLMTTSLTNSYFLPPFLDCQEYYTVHEEDAELIAREFFNTTKVIKTWGNKNSNYYLSTPRKSQKLNALTSPHQSLPVQNPSSPSEGFTYVTINRGYQLETILRVLLQEKRYRVEIYSVGDDRKWYLKKKGSPGNLSELEDILYANADMQESNILLAVRIGYDQGHRTVGAAFIDAILKKIGVCQMLDNDQLTNLESLIMQCGAKECYCYPLDDKDADSRKLREVLQKYELVVTEMKKTEFDTSNIEQDLKRLLGEKRFNSIKMTLIDEKFAMSATACLLHGLQLLSDSSNFGTYKLFRYDLSQYMRLDNAAVHALNILPNPRDPNQSHNLYGLLNRCRTAMGSRKLLQWLKQPLLDITQIKKRQDLVQLFYEDDNLCKELRAKCLKRIPDLERMAKKIQRGSANLQDCVIIYQFIQKLPEIIDALKRAVGDQTLLNEKFIAPFEKLHKDLSGFENLVEETIDLEMVEEGEYVINPSFDDELQDIANKKKRIVKKIKEREDEVKISLGSPSSFKIDNDKTHGWFFRISRKDEKLITGKKKEKLYTILQPISKAGIKFQDAEMRTLSDEYLELCALYAKKSADLVKEIMNIVEQN
jgi:DNA mismatch repair protein MSH2